MEHYTALMMMVLMNLSMLPGEGGAVAPGPGALSGGVGAAQPAVVVVRVGRQNRVHSCGGTRR